MKDYIIDDIEKQNIEYNFFDSLKVRSNEYYNSLINWDDPKDPLRKIIEPSSEELIRWGSLDFSGELFFHKTEIVEHKYSDTAILLCSRECAGHCRFCFRKRIFQLSKDNYDKAIEEGLKYISEHYEINNVLLSGGDPLFLSTKKIEKILNELVKIDHIKIIRVGTKILAFRPQRITSDKTLQDLFLKIGKQKRLVIITHFDHPNEISTETEKAIRCLKNLNIVLFNQFPLLKGINDSSDVISKLVSRLFCLGVIPYYIFACRHTVGNKSFVLPLEKAYSIFLETQIKITSGLLKNLKFVLSDKSGKIEIVGLDENYIYFRNHNMVDSFQNGVIRCFKRNSNASWISDYLEFNDDKII